jgi:cytochrome c oxidase subunit 2
MQVNQQLRRVRRLYKKSKGVVMKGRNMVRGVGVVFLMVGLAGMAGRGAHAGTNPRVIEITAKRFGFTPDQVTLKKGETVTLRLHSEDVTHGFFMRKLKIDTEIEPGHPTDVTITPDTAGSFTTICDHFCGANHGNMKMTIVVE